MEFWAEKGLSVGNTYLMNRSLHKYTRVARGQDGADIKSMICFKLKLRTVCNQKGGHIDLALVKRDLLRHVQDVKAVRGKGRGLSDHLAVQWKVRLVGAWIKRRDVMVGARMIRSEKPREHQYRERYDRSLEGKRVE